MYTGMEERNNYRGEGPKACQDICTRPLYDSGGGGVTAGSRLARFSSRTQSRSMLPQLSATAGLLYLQSSRLNEVEILHI